MQMRAPSSRGANNRRHPVQEREIIDVDNQVIPAVRNNKNKFNVPEFADGHQEGEDDGDRQGYLNAEEIEPKNLSRAEPLKDFVTEEICRGVFSSNWSYREEAIKALNDEITKGSQSDMYLPFRVLKFRLNFNDQAGLFVAIFGVVASTITDKISKVSDSAMELL